MRDEMMMSPDSETEELDEVYLHTISIHGREFQKFSLDNRIALEPVDDDEIERLDLQHRVFSKIFDGRLIFPPIPRLRRVLDCGYGAGSWAADVAIQFPDCRVIGLDISPHKNPDDTPDNLWLQIDDLNRRFTFPSNHFDLVHSCLLATGINYTRWLSYIADIKRVLRPGGWVQLVEIYFNVQSDNGSITEQHALRRWSTQLLRSYEELKDLRVGTRLNALLRAEGFEEVDARMIPLPLSAWSNDPRMRDIGLLNKENIQRLLPSLALYPLTQLAGMPQQEFQELISQAQQEAEIANLKPYFPLYVCIGRKPQ